MSQIKSALITGIGGSGGSYLAEYIVEHHPDVKVHGFARWHSSTQDNLQALCQACHNRLDAAMRERHARETRRQRRIDFANSSADTSPAPRWR